MKKKRTSINFLSTTGARISLSLFIRIRWTMITSSLSSSSSTTRIPARKRSPLLQQRGGWSNVLVHIRIAWATLHFSSWCAWMFSVHRVAIRRPMVWHANRPRCMCVPWGTRGTLSMTRSREYPMIYRVFLPASNFAVNNLAIVTSLLLSLINIHRLRISFHYDVSFN